MTTSGILLPSGQSNFFDYSQFHNDINKYYPSPSESKNFFTNGSGLYQTYPSGYMVIGNGSGILSPSGLINPLSSSSGIYTTITNLNIFGDYIHYYNNIRIPFVSTYKVSVGFNPYPRII